jgi:hypothetical protein
VSIGAGSPSYIFFYSSNNGAGAIGIAEQSKQFRSPIGDFSTLLTYPAGSFSTDWTDVVSYFDALIFYNSHTGQLAVVRFDSNFNPRTVKSYSAAASGTAPTTRLGRILTTNPRSAFNAGWTHLVATYNGMLFYNRRTGTGEFGRFDPQTGSYTFLNTFAGGVFGPLTAGYAQGWTHVVSSPEGILFYNAHNGRVQIGRIDTAGQFIRLNSYDPGAFSAGFSHIIKTRNGIMYYGPNENGRIAVGHIDDKGLWVNTTSFLNFYLAGGGDRGWTQVVEAIFK